MHHPSTPWLEGEQGKFLHDFERFIDYSNRVWANRAPGTVGPIAFRLLKAACEVRWNKNFFRYPYELQFLWKAGRALARLLDGEIPLPGTRAPWKQWRWRPSRAVNGHARSSRSARSSRRPGGPPEAALRAGIDPVAAVAARSSCRGSEAAPRCHRVAAAALHAPHYYAARAVPELRTFSLSRKSLASPAIIRRGAVLAGFVLVERLLLPVATWAFFRHSLAQQITLALAASAVFSARTFLQHAFRARTEVNLLERVAGRLIGGDVLRADVLRDEDARAELGQAMYHGAQNVSIVIPQLLADILAAPVLALVVIAREPPRLVALVVGMVIAIGAILLRSRRSIERALATAWSAQIEAYGAFMDALEGRLEIVASGRRLPFLEEMQARCAAWGKAGARVAAGALVSGKLPLLAVAALAAGVIGLATVGGREALGITTADIALLASMTPALSGVAQEVFALARSKRWMDVVASVLAEPLLGVGGQEAPPRAPATIAFEGVSFTYEGAAYPALRDLSFTWGPEPILRR